MSTFFFKTGAISTANDSKLKESLDKEKEAQRIDNWRLHAAGAEQLLEIETVKLSSKEVEHLIRAAGVDVEFTKAPQAR